MPMAPVPASRAALKAAGLEIKDVDAVTSHNPMYRQRIEEFVGEDDQRDLRG